MVRAALHTQHYDTKIKVSDADLAQVRLTRHDFYGDGNYTISPRLS